MKMNAPVKAGIIFLCFMQLYTAVHAQVYRMGPEAYLKGNSVEIGISGSGGFEGADVSTLGYPAGMHYRSNTDYFGFVANPQLDNWGTYDGDFFTPGTPENGWGVEIGGFYGNQYSNNCYTGGIPNAIPGTIIDTFSHNGCMSATWGGNLVDPLAAYDLDFIIEYQLNENDLFYTTKVKIINNGTYDLNHIFYYRNVDPDNNVMRYSASGYGTVNTVVSQPSSSCPKALVTATQSTPNNSYVGFAGIDTNFRVGHGGFLNRDGAEMWNGVGYTTTPGVSIAYDQAMYISYYIPYLAVGDTSEFRFVVILDASQAENAINSLFYFDYTGSLGLEPSPCTQTNDTITLCGGQNVDIELMGVNVNDFIWTWSPSNGLSTTAGTTVNAQPDSTVTYVVTGVPVNACFSINIEREIVVQVSASSADFDVNIDNPNCASSDGSLEVINITGIGGDINVQWTGGPANALYSGIPAGIYQVLVTDSVGCGRQETITLESISSLTSTAVVDAIAVCGASLGQFTVTAANGTPAYTYNIGAGPVSSGVFSGLAAGNYVVHIADAAGCNDTVYMTIADTNNLAASLADTNAAVCAGNNGSVSVQAYNGTGTYVYSIPGASGVSGNFTGLAPGVYTMSVTSGSCSTLVPFVIGAATGNLDLSLVSATAENCGMMNGQLVTQASGGTSPLLFTLGGTPQSTGTFTGLGDGHFVVTVTDINGCMDTVHAGIAEIPLVIDLGPDTSFCNGGMLQGSGTGHYTWSTGAETESIAVNQGGTYWLMVTTPGGCTAVDSVNLTILQNAGLFVPNVFTPNGDGINDKFEVTGLFTGDYRVNVFNRWGQQVFSSGNPDSPWDGKHNGNTVGEGAYMYVIQYVNQCESGAGQVETGTVQVFR